MADTKIVYGRYVVVDADTVIPSGALYIEGDRIADCGTHAEITGRHRAGITLGSAEALVIPALVNAHGHGKGLTDFQRGQLDDTLETWKWRPFPPVDPRLDTLWACVQLLESGVTATMHNHALVRPEEPLEELESVLDAYRQAGVRVALAPALSTENTFTYGEDEPFLASLPPDLRALAEDIRARQARFGEREYFETVAELARRHQSPPVRILHGPLAPQWVREEALLETRRQAAALGLRVHTHVQQTRLQRHYGLRRYGKSLLARLAEIGFLGPEVTCGHCVWVSEEDIGLLAAAGASVTHHPSCNLRVRNGIAPVAAMLERGVTVALGMDEKEMGDDKDLLAEMRVAARLHRLSSHRLDSPTPGPREVFRMATENGARVLGLDPWIGSLRPGMQADLAVVDLEALSAPYAWEGHHPLDLLVYRGKAAHVRTVLSAGETVLADGRPTRLDREEVSRRLRESLPAGYAERFRQAAARLAGLRAALADWFLPWHEEIERREPDPFYRMNGRG